jgi:hypothetical protein
MLKFLITNSSDISKLFAAAPHTVLLQAQETFKVAGN